MFSGSVFRFPNNFGVTSLSFGSGLGYFRNIYELFSNILVSINKFDSDINSNLLKI